MIVLEGTPVDGSEDVVHEQENVLFNVVLTVVAGVEWNFANIERAADNVAELA